MSTKKEQLCRMEQQIVYDKTANQFYLFLFCI